MNYWWVNQNQTYKTEIEGGFLWSPKTNKDGARNQFYDNMAATGLGDIIFSFCDTRIKAIGVVVGAAETAEKPNFGAAGANWAKQGWYVPVEFSEIPNPPRPKDFIDELRPFLSTKYAPLQKSGDGLQSVYLAAVSPEFAEVVLRKIGRSGGGFPSTAAIVEQGNALAQEVAITGRTDIGPTTKQQMIAARRGQGIFKANVRLNESRCRITAVFDQRRVVRQRESPFVDQPSAEAGGDRHLSVAVHRVSDLGRVPPA